MPPRRFRAGRDLLLAVLRRAEQASDRSVAAMLVLAVSTLLGFTAYYVGDRYTSPVPPVTDELLRRLEADVLRDPQSLPARIRVAWAYLDQGLFDPAILQFDEALKLEADSQAALIGKGAAYYRKGDVTAALAPLERVAALNEDRPDRLVSLELQGVYYRLGTIYSQLGQDAPAIAAFQKALAIDSVDADSLYGLGMVYARRTDLDAARPFLEKAVRLDPVFADAYRALHTLYRQRNMVGHTLLAAGVLAYINSQNDQALRLLQQATQEVPDLPEVYQTLGLIYEQQGQRTEALRAFQTALEKDPELILAQTGVSRLTGKPGPSVRQQTH